MIKRMYFNLQLIYPMENILAMILITIIIINSKEIMQLSIFKCTLS